MKENICLIRGCKNIVNNSTDIDIGVGIITFEDVCVCEQCYISNNPEIMEQIEIIENEKGMPF